MKLTYAKNCDVYYDTRQAAIVLAKRGNHFLLKRPREDMETIRDVMRICGGGCDIEDAFETISEEKRGQYFAFAKLLWQKRILIEDMGKEEKLSPAIMDLLRSNYDADPELIRYWTETEVLFAGLEEIRKTVAEYGIACGNYEGTTAEGGNKLYIGDFTAGECRRLLNGKNAAVLIRESEGTTYMLYMDRFDAEKYDRFRSFEWKESSRFYAKEKMIPIHLFMHCCGCIRNSTHPELLCLAGDGTLQNFGIGSLYTETAGYYNRELTPRRTAREALTQIEVLAGKNPWLVEGCNKNNLKTRQSPVCNFEIVFGSDFGGKSYTAYHEDYESAGIKAFCEGLEKMLKDATGSVWCCGSSKEDYYARGYISLLEKRNGCIEVTELPEETVGRLHYLEELIKGKVTVYWRPSQAEGIGGIVLCDDDGMILYDGPYGYNPEKNLMEAIWQVTGEAQTGKKADRTGRRKLTAEYDIAPAGQKLPEGRSAEETIRKLQLFFGERDRIIDEKIWAYQIQIQDTGMHVGKFYFVR